MYRDSTTEEVLALVCVLYGQQLHEDSNHFRLGARTVARAGSDLVIHDRTNKTSWRFLDLYHAEYTRAFKRLWHGIGNTLSANVSPLTQSLHWPLCISTVELAETLALVTKATHLTADKHRVRVAILTRDNAEHGYTFQFTGTLATASCRRCRRQRRVPLVRPRVQRGRVSHANQLIVVFVYFWKRHCHINAAV